ncbi:TetR/AcrR family transcriptional regulator [Lichenibacterium minor]|uniref:TetR/AcrR family transcriptional regulator n=1 Tax=Lichenibacterium minor TaxID=2316528 RepID=A0A4V1RUH8_9HYPH|nr:TetR/AcrR family transcriptional regulator [Lichenibacterium minor]RYC31204.1 TetR/AcrR family transcriptional regulator [Lichenibacterium minor]
MSITALAVEAEDAPRTRILEAAERAFARHGFRGATMQIVAAEARMSAGNLYRYFSSKEALVSGLAERDQAALAEDFATLDVSEDPLAAMGVLLRKHLVEAPKSCSQLALEIWAESGRNPDVARICRTIEDDVQARLAALVEGPCRAAGIAPDFAVRVIFTVTAGLFKRHATDARFDGEAEVALALGVYHALFAGAVRPRAALGAEAAA